MNCQQPCLSTFNMNTEDFIVDVIFSSMQIEGRKMDCYNVSGIEKWFGVERLTSNGN